MHRQWWASHCAVMTAGADIFIIWRSIRNIRDSDLGSVWSMNAWMVCVAREFSARSFWSRTIIRAAASSGSTEAGKKFQARWRWGRIYNGRTRHDVVPGIRIGHEKRGAWGKERGAKRVISEK